MVTKLKKTLPRKRYRKQPREGIRLKQKQRVTSYNGFYAREERTYTNLVPQIEKMI